MTEELYDRIREAVAETLKLSPSAVTADSSAETLDEWDSLAQVNLIVTLEESFDLELDIDEFMQLTSVHAIAKYLHEHGGGNA